MEKPKITFVISGNTYRLSADDAEAIRAIPLADRQELILLLEYIKKQDRVMKAKAHQRKDIASISANPTSNLSSGQTLEDKSLGKGDVDNLMARLMFEEKRNHKSLPTKNSLYKWLGIFIAVIVLLFLIF